MKRTTWIWLYSRHHQTRSTQGTPLPAEYSRKWWSKPFNFQTTAATKTSWMSVQPRHLNDKAADGVRAAVLPRLSQQLRQQQQLLLLGVLGLLEQLLLVVRAGVLGLRVDVARVAAPPRQPAAALDVLEGETKGSVKGGRARASRRPRSPARRRTVQEKLFVPSPSFWERLFSAGHLGTCYHWSSASVRCPTAADWPCSTISRTGSAISTVLSIRSAMRSPTSSLRRLFCGYSSATGIEPKQIPVNLWEWSFTTTINCFNARIGRRNWTKLNWHCLVFDKLTNGQAKRAY